jgi:two-component system, OmpR family, alkaline phosphatase synthesis response regulator PhoP
MNDGRQRVLIIEDEPDMVRGLRDVLDFEGYEVVSAATGQEGLRLARDRGADLVILDLMLPDTNGYEVCQSIRAFNRTVPVLMLTARAQEGDKVRGFGVGADDYVTKPFSVAELCARIRAILRRASTRSAPNENIIRVGAATIDLRKQTVSRGKETEPLTFYETELMRLLWERRDEPLSRDEILERVWGVQPNPSNRTVDNFILKLRRKIEDNHHDPRHILTIHGQGYKLVV